MLRAPAKLHGLDVVRFVTPTSDAARLKVILDGASGYLYYISFAGTTGTKQISESDVREGLGRLRTQTSLPCTVGFGIRTPEQASEVGRAAEGVVVGHGGSETLKWARIVPERRQIGQEPATAGLW